MVHSLYQTYKKYIIVFLILLSGLLFWFFGCQKTDVAPKVTEKWEKVTLDNHGCRYDFAIPDLEGSVSFGTDGFVSVDKTLPVVVRSIGKKKEFNGIIKITLPGENGLGVAYQAALNCKKGIHQKQVIDVPQLGNAACFYFEIKDQFGNTIFQRAVRTDTFHSADQEKNPLTGVGILSDSFESFSYMDGLLLETENCHRNVQTLKLSVKDFPTDARELTALDAIIIDHFDTAKLTEVQYKALKEWIYNGGQLILGTGEDSESVLSAFREQYGITEVSYEAKNISLQGKEGMISGLHVTLCNFEFQVNKHWANAVKSIPDVIYKRRSGKGRIYLSKFSLADDSFIQWRGRDQAMEALLSNSVGEQFEQAYYDNALLWYLKMELSTFVDSQAPNTVYYGVFLIIYIAVLAFVGHYLLRQIKKREYIWIVIPMIAVAFSFLIMIRVIGSSRNFDNTVSAIRIEDRDQKQNDVYLLYQNKDGKGGRVGFMPYVKNLMPLDYEYDRQVLDTVSPAQNMIISDTVSGIDIDIGEEVPGSTILMRAQLDKETDKGSSRKAVFRVIANAKEQKFMGSIQNLTNYMYDRVMIIRGSQYIILDQLKSGETRKIADGDVKTWSFTDAERMDIGNLISFLAHRYITDEKDSTEVIVIGITGDADPEVFHKETALSTGIFVDVRRYPINEP